MPGINHGRFSCSFLRKDTACKREVFVSTSSILPLFLFLCASIQQVLVICTCLSLLIFRARMSWTNSWSSFGTLMAGTDRKSRKKGKSEGYWCLWYVSSNAFHVFMIFETFRSWLMSFIDNLQSPNNVSRLHSCSSSLKGSQRKQDMTGLSFLPDSTMQNTKTVTLKWSSSHASGTAPFSPVVYNIGFSMNCGPVPAALYHSRWQTVWDTSNV